VKARPILIALCALAFSCNPTGSKPKTAFTILTSKETAVEFQNEVESTEDFNIIEYLYFYNGAGVAAGDINNDGLPDLYFAANQQPNRLYVNQGNFRFKDISETAGVPGLGNWKTGVTMADVNGDGLLDIFSCGVGRYKKFNGGNRLYINNGDLTFSDRTNEFGLTFSGFSTQAGFFDYDNDGDLDMFLLNHSVHSVRSYRDIRSRLESDPLSGDKLYRNNVVPTGTAGFTEVTSAAGIFSGTLGYGLGLAISDINRDGFQDIYVTNDFHENDYLYLNQHDGTFRQELEKSTGHLSRFSMGVDIGDLNGDGWPDIVTVDMLPFDEQVIKTTAGEDPFDIFSFKLSFGFHYQYSRNCIQLNHGVDQNNTLQFSEIAAYSGIEATDWSWSPLMVDLDNDGVREIFITSGIPGRPNDLDFINYIESDSAQRYFSDRQLYTEMPEGSAPNAIFRQKRGMKYENVAANWIGDTKGLSNGATVADFDADGDADIVTNNFNAAPYFYRNDLETGGSIKVRLKGIGFNRFGIGARIIGYVGDTANHIEQNPVRGFMSAVDTDIIVGLGSHHTADSIVVVWTGGASQTLHNIPKGSTVVFRQEDAKEKSDLTQQTSKSLLAVAPSEEIAYEHVEDEFIEFESQRLMPYTLSTQGPAFVKGDVNSDGLEDIFIGGAAGKKGAVFLQDQMGRFRETIQKHIASDSAQEDTDACFFDANGDGWMDLVVVSGVSGVSHAHGLMQPRLYINNRHGVLIRSLSFPRLHIQASVVACADIDRDGDQDMFIGARAMQGKFGAPAPSYLLVNDAQGNFTEAPSSMWKRPEDMITDVVWTDINNDSRPDLVVVGDWMNVTLMVNENGVLIDRSKEYGLHETSGWWQCVVAADIDNDGDVDLLAGNMGENSRLRPTMSEPVELYAGDIDNNGSIEQVITYYNSGIRHPFLSRDQLVRQVPSMKKKFLHYRNYAQVQLEDILAPSGTSEFSHHAVTVSQSMLFRNTGRGSFVMEPLPEAAQLFPVFDLQLTDVNHDGLPDLLAVGNLFGAQAELGRFDAGWGLMMTGSGEGIFTPVKPAQSGFVVPGEGREIEIVKTSNGTDIIVVARSNGAPMVFKKN
jgi:hypothetical protein